MKLIMENLTQISSDEMWQRVIEDSEVRQEVTRENLLLHWTLYYAPHLPKQYDIAPFQKEIMAVLQDRSKIFFVLEGFRGSSKTSIANTVYTVWSIVGCQQIKSVLIVCQTQEQARQCLANIKSYMQKEPLLSDMGPFQEPDGQWRSSAIDIPKYGARIAVASIDQPIRGMIHDVFRPQVVICDDLENFNSARSTDLRAKLWNAFTSDILPVGVPGTRFIIIGTRLHEDSLIMRLKKQIEKNERDGIFRSYPIVSADGQIAWPGKYPTKEDVIKEKRRIANTLAWRREYLLELVSDEEQIIKSEWIKYYDRLPSLSAPDYMGTFLAIDPAIKENSWNDYTAMLAASVFGTGKDRRIYIRREYVNKRLTPHKIIGHAQALTATLALGHPVTVLIEDVAYQYALILDARAEGLTVEGIKLGGTDKAVRLMGAAGPTEAGQVLFPTGEDEIVRNITGFGVEKHDDIPDAFSMLVRKAVEMKAPDVPEIFTMIVHPRKRSNFWNDDGGGSEICFIGG